MIQKLIDSRNRQIKEWVDYNSSMEHEKGYGIWTVKYTPLKKYCSDFDNQLNPPRPNFERLLADKADSSGSILNVFDLGIGSGERWLPFLAIRKINLMGINLAESQEVHPNLREFIKACNAADLHKFFQPNSIDVFVSHFGVKHQAPEIIENAIYVSKPGGIILLSDRVEYPNFNMVPGNVETIEMCASDTQYYRVIAKVVPDLIERDWFLWLEKK